jgi:Cu2+-containing amine oxidase
MAPSRIEAEATEPVTNGSKHVHDSTTATDGAKAPPAYRSHPLGPLSADEITLGSSLLTNFWPAGTDVHFKAVTLLEPAKAELIPYLTAERAGQPKPDIDRRAFVLYYLRGTVSVQLHANSPCSRSHIRTA